LETFSLNLELQSNFFDLEVLLIKEEFTPNARDGTEAIRNS